MKLFLRILFTSFFILNFKKTLARLISILQLMHPLIYQEHLENIDPNSTQELTLRAEGSKDKKFLVLKKDMSQELR